MLSDSLYDAAETIWEAILHYDYADSHKEQLVTSIVELKVLIFQLDGLRATKEAIRVGVEREWALRMQHIPVGSWRETNPSDT